MKITHQRRSGCQLTLEMMDAINDGVAEMLIRGTDLPSINASLRVARSVRQARQAASFEFAS